MTMDNTFRFKQFTVCQDRTAMKVGTDGVLLGAWAHGGQRILDVGCGTGVVALMMAQRFKNAEVVGIDIDADAAAQASENVMSSPWAERMRMFNVSLQSFGDESIGEFDSIVCNPPFFAHNPHSSVRAMTASTPPDHHRAVARHDASLPLSTLFHYASRLLSDGGELSIVYPFASLSSLRAEAAICGLFESRCYHVSTVEGREPKRVLAAFIKHRPVSIENASVAITAADGNRSTWMRNLTAEFYL